MRKLDLARGFIVIGTMILLGRLLHIFVAQNAHYTRLAEQNRIRTQRILPLRGTLSDRTGEILAQGRRVYENHEVFSHIIGYIGQANEREIQQDSCSERLVSGDAVGKLGAELFFECRLRGVPGRQTYEVRATEAKHKILQLQDAVNGEDITLALNAQLQRVAYAALNGRKGAIVILKPNTGELLGLVSSPGFTTQTLTEVIKDEAKPLLNRAIHGLYPPGSVYKMVVAFAGLASGTVTPDETIVDNGKIKAGEITFGNWYFLEYGKTDGVVDMIKSIQRSNDIYYYTLGARVGPEILRTYALRFGYGQQIDTLLQDASGLVPYPFWKKEKLNSKWFLGDTYNTSIGQGYLEVTPLQVAQMTQIIAMRGERCGIHIEKVDVQKKLQKDLCKDVQLPAAYFDPIIRGMQAACQPGGTGWPLFTFPVPVACKTGTAENKQSINSPHAWFTVFAPIEEPEIVATILVEGGGQGSDVAAPIAKDILAAYFDVQIDKETPEEGVLHE